VAVGDLHHARAAGFNGRHEQRQNWKHVRWTNAPGPEPKRTPLSPSPVAIKSGDRRRCRGHWGSPRTRQSGLPADHAPILKTELIFRRSTFKGQKVCTLYRGHSPFVLKPISRSYERHPSFARGLVPAYKRVQTACSLASPSASKNRRAVLISPLWARLTRFLRHPHTLRTFQSQKPALGK